MKSQKAGGAEIALVYQDSEIVLINKPAGLASQGGAGVSRSVDTVLPEQLGQKIYLCHRLDKETSGLLLCAKSPAAANKWSRLIGEKSVVKEYKALCFGRPPSPRGKISLPIVERGQSKAALTYYQLEKEIVGSRPTMTEDTRQSIPLSLMRLTLATGRAHQIRIHLAKIGLPIAGDDQHGDFKLNKEAKKILGIKRLCLCAFRLALPLEGGQKTFEIPCFFDAYIV